MTIRETLASFLFSGSKRSEEKNAQAMREYHAALMKDLDEDAVSYLNSVDWEELDSGGFPDTKGAAIRTSLLQIFSEDEKVRQDVYWRLDNNIVIQGGLYEAAAYATRFISRVIKSNADAANYEVLELLVQVAAGRSDKVIMFNGEIREIWDHCSTEIMTAKEELVTIAVTNKAERSAETAFDILAVLATRLDPVSKFLAENYRSGKLKAYEDRLKEDGII